MKSYLLLLQLLYALFLPAIVRGQKTDSIRVVRDVDSLLQVSRTFTGAGAFEQALAANSAAEKLALETLGRESETYGSACFNRGRILFYKEDYTEAEQWYLTAMAIREKVLGKGHADYVRSLNNLAILYQQTGNYEKAERVFLEGISLQQQYLNDNNPERARIMTSLGYLYVELGEYEKAERIYAETLSILEKASAKENIFYSVALGGLANLYKERGAYGKAIDLYSEALSLQEKKLGKDNVDYIRSLYNLANVYYSQNNLNEALPLYLEARQIVERVLGKEHSEYATCLDNLANVYHDQGAYEQALPLRLEARAIWEKTLGKENLHYTITLNNLANLYRDIGDYDHALPLYLEARDIRVRILGEKHPAYATSLTKLALIYMAKGDNAKAASYFIAASQTLRALIQDASAYSSEKEMLEYREVCKEGFGDLLQFARIYGNDSLLMAAYDNALFLNNALLAQAIAREKDIVHADSSTQALYGEWKSCYLRLSRQYSLPIASRDAAQAAGLEQRANDLEKELARRSKTFLASKRDVHWKEVQQKLEPGEAALEFVRYEDKGLKDHGDVLYAALVLMRNNPLPKLIPLFEEKELASLLAGATGGSNFLKINALYRPRAAGSKLKSLYELIWKPMEGQLQGINTVYCAPSGLLHRLNLAAIPDAAGKPFGDRRQLVLLGSTRQLVVADDGAQQAGRDAYLAGGIRYDSDSMAIAYANRSASVSRNIGLSGTFAFEPDSTGSTRSGMPDYLPATAAEVSEIGQILTKTGIAAKVDTGFYATEEAFRQLGAVGQSPRIVHLATHGYFFPDPQKADTGGPVFKMSEHPMIRSGLIMAGAKQAWLTGRHPAGQEDGILTAYEISQMNLSGTELVVLSACETGLGDIMGSEGVYGLQRAFKIAGAKYLIMSLWKVDDRSTRDFMTAFYRHWLTGKQSVPQAFRATQREMQVKHPSPYDWAGFILIE